MQIVAAPYRKLPKKKKEKKELSFETSMLTTTSSNAVHTAIYGRKTINTHVYYITVETLDDSDDV